MNKVEAKNDTHKRLSGYGTGFKSVIYILFLLIFLLFVAHFHCLSEVLFEINSNSVKIG
jgi:hypothetical protein